MQEIELSTDYFSYSQFHELTLSKRFECSQNGFLECLKLAETLCHMHFGFNFSTVNSKTLLACANSTLYPSDELSFENLCKTKGIYFHAFGEPSITLKIIDKE